MTTPRPRAALPLVFLTVFIDLLGFGFVIPLLPVYSEMYRAGPETIGLLMSSFSAMQFVFAGPAQQLVVAAAPVQAIVAGAAFQHIALRAIAGQWAVANQHIVAVASPQGVGAQATDQVVVAGAPIHDIEAGATVHGIVAAANRHDIGTVATEREVVLLGEGDAGETRIALQHVAVAAQRGQRAAGRIGYVDVQRRDRSGRDYKAETVKVKKVKLTKEELGRQESKKGSGGKGAS